MLWLGFTLIVLAFVVFVVLAHRRHWHWTGLTELRRPARPGEEVRPAKTLWDWLQLFVIPLALAGLAFLLNDAQSSREQRHADRLAARQRTTALDAAREDTLRAYMTQMSELMLDRGLLRSRRGANVRAVGRTATFTAVRRLDGERRGLVVRFLFEARLVRGHKPRIDLRDSDLRGANLQDAVLPELNVRGANLEAANLRGAFLPGAQMEVKSLARAGISGAILVGASLVRANLRRANLYRATLTGADLQWANLQAANLQRARLHGLGSGSLQTGGVVVRAGGADLRGADLRGADLRGAHLRDANLRRADLRRARLRGADFRGADLRFARLDAQARIVGARLK